MGLNRVAERGRIGQQQRCITGAGIELRRNVDGKPLAPEVAPDLFALLEGSVVEQMEQLVMEKRLDRLVPVELVDDISPEHQSRAFREIARAAVELAEANHKIDRRIAAHRAEGLL